MHKDRKNIDQYACSRLYYNANNCIVTQWIINVQQLLLPRLCGETCAFEIVYELLDFPGKVVKRDVVHRQKWKHKGNHLHASATSKFFCMLSIVRWYVYTPDYVCRYWPYLYQVVGTATRGSCKSLLVSSLNAPASAHFDMESSWCSCAQPAQSPEHWR